MANRQAFIQGPWGSVYINETGVRQANTAGGFVDETVQNYVPPPPPGNKGGGSKGGGNGKGNGGGNKPPKPASSFDPYGRYASYYAFREQQDSIRRRRVRSILSFGTTYDNAIALAARAAIAASHTLSITKTATLAAVLSQIATTRLDALGLTTLDHMQAISASSGGVLDAYASIEVAVGLSGDVTLSVATAAMITAHMAQSVASRLDAAASASLRQVNRVAAGSIADLQSVAALGLSLAQLALGTLALQQSSAIGLSLGADGGGAVTVEGVIALDAVAGVSDSVQADLHAPLQFRVALSSALATQLDAQAIVDLAAALAWRIRIAANEPIADLVELQGILATRVALSGTLDQAVTLTGTLVDLVELAGIKDIGADLEGVFEITITLDGRTLN